MLVGELFLLELLLEVEGFLCQCVFELDGCITLLFKHVVEVDDLLLHAVQVVLTGFEVLLQLMQSRLMLLSIVLKLMFELCNFLHLLSVSILVHSFKLLIFMVYLSQSIL